MILLSILQAILLEPLRAFFSSETTSGLSVANWFNLTPNVASCSAAKRPRGNHIPLPGHFFQHPATQFVSNLASTLAHWL